MGIVGRAFRNISRRKIRALLVVIALGFSMAILITIPAGVFANQKTANNVTSGLNSAINQTGLSINQTLSEITCSLSSGLSGFGFPIGGGSGFSGSGRSGFGGTGGSTGNGGFFATSGGTFGGGSTTPMNESLYSDISGISGVAAVEPLLEANEGGQNETFTTPYGSFTRTVPAYTIEGIPLTSEFVNDYDILPTNITSGQNLQVGEVGDVLLSESNAAYFNTGVGQTVNILGENFQVAGIHGSSAFSISGGASDSLVLYMGLSDAQTITNNVGNVTSLIVYAQNPDLVSQVSSSITSLHPELSVTPPFGGSLQTSEANTTTVQQSAENALNQSNQMALEEIVIVVAATSLIVLFVMLYTVRERTKEIGTLKALGFSNGAVMGQFLFEGIILSVIAGAVGIAIGVLAAPQLSKLLLPMNPFGSVSGASGVAVRLSNAASASVSVSPELMLIGFGVAVALGAIGSLYPAWRAAKIRPAEAMRYE